ncbi:uncharacterized protein LACBIDRAFT_335782 [Laccaria bicolor S238N-H82]|uniref:Predicted protein n=1 Tax=Laccaria bicolor (strain S238N-H82 / ATCC MYA-4686) TaxID=486041 RepID=B0DRP9_LACBS|nr:uncharacterized protein LACBIDRAFT_332134 [Laccaria bicolor S238N-H82]XP_001890713.1 uncharacterized protein LACBIDRAFT_335782 [Laccaria bicolor S238N-H82]EDQ98647.1 predicted protein [Laccaria bicolor S238N-H82]EDR02644.1 predicted protein [Laccaria bicolor S238N-H82]|eukprot:XP_001886688.1 predicted protein [Laccaria bicolor S238N-H82]
MCCIGDSPMKLGRCIDPEVKIVDISVHQHNILHPHFPLSPTDQRPHQKDGHPQTYTRIPISSLSVVSSLGFCQVHYWCNAAHAYISQYDIIIMITLILQGFTHIPDFVSPMQHITEI